MLTIDELINNKEYSVNDIADGIRISFNFYSWPNVENPVNIIGEIYNQLNSRLKNKKVLFAFPGFDDFVLLKEKYKPSYSIMTSIVKKMQKLDFKEINEKIKCFYEEIPEKKKAERESLTEKLYKEENKKDSFHSCNLILEKEAEFNSISTQIKDFNTELNALNNELRKQQEKKMAITSNLKELKDKYTTLNSGLLNKIIKHKELNKLKKNISKYETEINIYDNKINELKTKIDNIIQQIKELKNNFQLDLPFISFEKFPEKLEEAKLLIKTFSSYDENESISLINKYKSKIQEIDDFLERNYPKSSAKSIS